MSELTGGGSEVTGAGSAMTGRVDLAAAKACRPALRRWAPAPTALAMTSSNTRSSLQPAARRAAMSASAMRQAWWWILATNAWASAGRGLIPATPAAAAAARIARSRAPGCCSGAVVQASSRARRSGCNGASAGGRGRRGGQRRMNRGDCAGSAQRVGAFPHVATPACRPRRSPIPLHAMLPTAAPTVGRFSWRFRPRMSFVHLHLHTQFSIADGATRIADAVAAAKRFGSPALALTDHDNLHGAIEFTDACQKHGIQPIYGCCLSIAHRAVGEHVRRTHRLTLLAETPTGWKNLLHLISMAHLKAPLGGFARVDPTLLAEHKDGLICLSGDLGSEVSNAILRQDFAEARRHAERYRDLFGPEHFFLEIQAGGLQEYDTVRPHLLTLADQVGVRGVASNDVHYLARPNARAHEVLMCIGLGIQARPENMALPTDQLDFASPEEMRARFAGHDDLCDETLRIAARCQVKLELGTPILPRFPVPDGGDEVRYFAEVARAGLDHRLASYDRTHVEYDRERYVQRLEREIQVITDMDFPGYFLIVWDFIKWAKDNGIPVGPGRGSGAGSLVAWSMRITDLDPLPYGLLFERFLNPGRKSLPDFDIDFCVVRRGEVIDYVAQRYGRDRVGQIATFGTLKAKGALRDVGRVLGVPLPDVDQIAKLVPNDAKSLADAMEREPRLRERADLDPTIGRLIETAGLLEGAVRNVGIHAAGVVISRGPLWEHVPVGRGANNEIVAQFDKDDVEKAGLVKFDFLGLKNLTMIRHCVELVNSSRAAGTPALELDRIALDDKAAFDVIGRGDTPGIFQMESSGFTAMVQGLKPSRFEDVIAAGALYRPGPLGMGMHTRYIERKHGREPVVFEHPSLAGVLEETYGVIVYQEQVMQVAQILAGFSLADADDLRRAMGKKKVDEMAKWGQTFKDGATQRGVEPDTATRIFGLMASFAEYGFNKSHAAAYGLVSYHTAWLKAHHPTEFYAALLTADQGDTDSVVAYIQHARASGQKVLPPGVNESERSFTVTGGAIRFGLGAIKGLGEAAIDALILARASKPYASLFDLCRRLDLRKFNRRALECLVKSGACDAIGPSRDVVFANIGRAIDTAAAEQKERDSAQASLFGMLGGAAPKRADAYDTAAESWTQRQMLAFEKEVLGFYVTGHPLDRYARELGRLQVTPLARLKDPEILKERPEHGRRAPRTVAVVVVEHREKATQAGSRMAFTTIEDRSGQAEILVFARTLDQCGALLQSDAPLLLKLTPDADRNDDTKVKLVLEEARPLDDVVLAELQALRIRLGPEQCEARRLREVASVLEKAPGAVRVQFQLRLPHGEVTVQAGPKMRVAVSEELIGTLERMLGRGSVGMG
ncbi:MAG: DNA polymerase III subunit alpha [Myxococcales bacterium]|nr:DNA polymerase III subunit alpha [Myxococcales bacterium]